MSSERVVVGRVVKPHGIRGEVAVQVLSDVTDRLAEDVEVVVGGEATTIAASRPHQGRLLVRFEHVTDRDGAERLRGAPIEVAPLEREEHDRYFVHELVGLDVLGERGEALGRVVAWIELPDAADYDLLEVDDGERSWLLPAVEDFVVIDDTDEPAVLRLVDPPEGLMDLGTRSS